MDQTSEEMENIRHRIRAALDQSPDKSQKELAKLLNVSPAQVTSLLSPGGRWLQAPELPIVERYLGIALLKRPRFPSRRGEPGLPPKLAPVTAEGRHVVLSETHPDIARYLESVIAGRSAEVWQIATDLVQEAGYLRGDYVVIDKLQHATAGDVVLAEVRTQVGEWLPVFRVFRPPSLRVANSSYRHESPLPLRDGSVAVIGPIIASVRDSRAKKMPGPG